MSSDECVVTICPECGCGGTQDACWFCGGEKRGARIATIHGSSVTYDPWVEDRPV